MILSFFVVVVVVVVDDLVSQIFTYFNLKFTLLKYIVLWKKCKL